MIAHQQNANDPACSRHKVSKYVNDVLTVCADGSVSATFYLQQVRVLVVIAKADHSLYTDYLALGATQGKIEPASRSINDWESDLRAHPLRTMLFIAFTVHSSIVHLSGECKLGHMTCWPGHPYARVRDRKGCLTDKSGDISACRRAFAASLPRMLIELPSAWSNFELATSS